MKTIDFKYEAQLLINKINSSRQLEQHIKAKYENN